MYVEIDDFFEDLILEEEKKSGLSKKEIIEAILYEWFHEKIDERVFIEEARSRR